MKTSIIILTHNQLALTMLCLDSISRHTPEEHEIIVVDNASTDGTAMLMKARPSIKTVFNSSNLGFAKGCNQGLEIADGDYVLFLNNDTIVTEGWLTAMYHALQKDEDCVMVGPVSNYVSGHQCIPVTYSELSELDEFALSHRTTYAGVSFEVPRLIGFCLLLSKSLADELGGFDERFGLGNFEDDDLCLRILNKGYTMRVAYDSFIHHFGHATMSILTETNLIEMHYNNQEKAKGKWGRDIHELIYSPPAGITCFIAVRGNLETTVQSLESVQGISSELFLINLCDTEGIKEVSEAHQVPILELPCGEVSEEEAFVAAIAAAGNELVMWIEAGEQLTWTAVRELRALRRTFTADAASLLIGSEDSTEAQIELGEVRRIRIANKRTPLSWDTLGYDMIPGSGAQVIDTSIVIRRS